MKAFDVKLYGEGGGVMCDFTLEAASAEAACDATVEKFRGYPQAATVGVWAQDGKSGNVQKKISDAHS